MNYLNLTYKLLIFIGWWVNYPPFFKGNLEKTLKKLLINKNFIKYSYGTCPHDS